MFIYLFLISSHYFYSLLCEYKLAICDKHNYIHMEGRFAWLLLTLTTPYPVVVTDKASGTNIRIVVYTKLVVIVVVLPVRYEYNSVVVVVVL